MNSPLASDQAAMFDALASTSREAECVVDPLAELINPGGRIISHDGCKRLFLGLHLSGTDAILAMEPGGLAAQVTHRAAASDA